MMKQESLPSRVRSPQINGEHRPDDYLPGSQHDTIHNSLATGDWVPGMKSEHDQQEHDVVPEHAAIDPPWPGLPLRNEQQDRKEQEAIRNLFDMPEVEIPAWERQREPAALKPKLMPHQRVGLTWLIQQEHGAHKGGILADEMGLGKTIQALSLILARPPQDGTRKTTLIVVPTSLLRQWEREIDEKVKPGHKLKTFIFHGQKKRNMTVAKLLAHDIVLTTYGTLAHEYKQVFDRRQTQAAVLLASHAIFHRIILDEAHNIKNRNSLMSKATDRLHGTFRLCMTGTPLMNRLDELYPLIRFLRIEPYRKWEVFRPNFSSLKEGDSSVMKKLHVLLRRILLRRTENTKVDGQPILTLPALTVNTVEAFFDKDQADYYEALEHRSKLQVNRYLKEGTIMRHYWYILLLILRLRQCCCHPHLIKDHAIPEGIDMTHEQMTKLAFRLSARVVDRIKQQSNFECPMCHEKTENPIIVYPCGHHICGDCITNMAAAKDPRHEIEDNEEGTHIGYCPTQGCTESINSKQVLCHKNFVEAHPDSDTEDRSLDGSDSLQEDDEDEDGDLKDFVVSDDHESSYGSEPDDNQRGDQNRDHTPKIQLDSPHSEVEKDSDDSDDSLPPIDSLFSRIKKKVESTKANSRSEYSSALANLSDTTQNKINNTLSSRVRRARRTDTDRSTTTNSEDNLTDEEGGSSLGQKRKRSPAKGLNKPKKKAKHGKRNGKGRATELTLGALKQSSLNSATAKERYFKGLRKDWETSAKIEKAMELLGTIRREFPDEKTLVFSQFTSFLDLMEIPISDDGYNYRRYDGSMPNGDREAAVDDFMKKPEVKILLVSLRCGNAGLNLYAATRVIILDPFWNPSVEDQAIKRAHRLGQTRPVVAYRILVEDTVEDRILALQEKKKQLVNDVLDPEARQGVSRLSVSEIAGLFGIRWTR
ncbi:hypothetical protein F5Y19DRAFT_72252 [Xylariaceae sp. FL1651]|nr:hypothetical protein F5Y19DRAFT_72252 [Xylariaceae sp. FL1651]